jgi:hypothetical protein
MSSGSIPHPNAPRCRGLDMPSLHPHDTGLSFAVYVARRGGAPHDVRVTATQPPWGSNPAAVYALRPFARVEGEGVDWLSERQQRDLAVWAGQNVAALVEFWEGRIFYDEELFRGLRPIGVARPRNFRLAVVVLHALAPKVRSIGWSDGSYQLTFDRRIPNAMRLVQRFVQLGFRETIRMQVSKPKTLGELFKIGCEFYCGGKRWRCTDVGSRVIVAICLDDHPGDLSWFNGPPYAVVEHVFDEYSQPACEVI